MPHGIPPNPYPGLLNSTWIGEIRRRNLDSFESDQLQRESLTEQQALQHPDPLDPDHPSPEGED